MTSADVGISSVRLAGFSAAVCYMLAMMRMWVRYALLGTLLVAPATLDVPAAHAQEQRSLWADTRDDSDLSVGLVTFGRGDAIHEYFGHNALLIEDRARQISAVYNFGMFDFGADMLIKYVHGQLEFWAADTPVGPTFRHYIGHNRSIRVRELNLAPAKRRMLAERLEFAVRPENAAYRYHHFKNNCSTKVRDLIDDAIGGQLRRQYQGPARLTYRGHTRRYTQHDPIVSLALTLWMNDSMERPLRGYDEAYLPDELERMVEHAHYVTDEGKTVSLVSGTYTVFEANRPAVPAMPSRGWPAWLAFGSALGTLAILLSVAIRRGSRASRVLLGILHIAVGAGFGLLGTVAFFGLFTEWDVTKYNENLFLTNPLTMLALPLGFFVAAGSARAERALGLAFLMLATSTLLLMLLKLLPAFDQDTSLTMALFAPINFGFAAAHLNLRRAASKERAPLTGLVAHGASIQDA